MRQAESSRDTVQRRKNSCLRDAFVFFLWQKTAIHDPPATQSVPLPDTCLLRIVYLRKTYYVFCDAESNTVSFYRKGTLNHWHRRPGDGLRLQGLRYRDISAAKPILDSQKSPHRAFYSLLRHIRQHKNKKIQKTSINCINYLSTGDSAPDPIIVFPVPGLLAATTVATFKVFI